MSYLRPSLSQLQQQALADMTAAQVGGISTLLPKSILRVLAYVVAGLSWSHYGFLDWISRESVPFTATDTYLEAWAALKGVYRITAQPAAGSVSLVGFPGAPIPQGTLIARADGWQYATTVASALGTTAPNTGRATVPIQSVLPGASGNAASGVALTVANPLAGINSSCLAATPLAGGADQETDNALRTRMLQQYASPPQGGALGDYVDWALACPGVTRAWSVQGGTGGNGSVTVYAMMDNAEAAHAGFMQGGNGGATSETRFSAATGDQLTVANFIYPLRPATAIVYVAAPTPATINFTIANLGSSNTTAVQQGIAAALSSLFLRLGTPLGGSIYQSDVAEALSAVPGIAQYTVTSPALPIVTAAGSIATLGTVTCLT